MRVGLRKRIKSGPLGCILCELKRFSERAWRAHLPAVRCTNPQFQISSSKPRIVPTVWIIEVCGTLASLGMASGNGKESQTDSILQLFGSLRRCQAADQFFKRVSRTPGHKDTQPLTEASILRPMSTATLGQLKDVASNWWRRHKKKVNQGIIYSVSVKKELSGRPVIKKQN
jgi:hypothetical protein